MSRIRLAASIAVFPASLIILAWGVWPSPRQTASLEVVPGATALSLSAALAPENLSSPDLSRLSSGGTRLEPTKPMQGWSAPAIAPDATVAPQSAPALATSAVAMPHVSRVSLVYPALMRSGDSDVVRLSLIVDPQGSDAGTAPESLTQAQAGEIPDVFDTHNVVAEAQLDVPGLDLRPSATVREPLFRGRAVSFFWSVHATSEGTYDGTAWLFLVFVDRTTGEQSRNAISAQSLHMPATSFFGLWGGAARGLGGIGCLIGGVVGFPLVEETVNLAWRRIRKPS